MSTVNKKALMIYNPCSGKKGNHKAFPILVKNLEEMGYQLDVYHPTKVRDSDHPIKKACQNKWDAIFIAGGDGTVNQTLQFIAEEEYRPPIGVFPFGTSNEFAKYIGACCNAKALSIIKRGKTKPVDIGKFGNRYFANIAAAGWLSDITYKTPPSLKSSFGEFAYGLHFLKTFFLTKQSAVISVEVSPNEVISDVSLFLIMNGNSVGPFERLIKNSTYNDGSFHLLTLKQTNRLQLFFSLLAIMLNIAENPSIIRHTKIKTGSFSIPDSVALNLDGEQAFVKGLKFSVLPQHLDVFSLTL
ncbi:diacylglycerol kinase (ATP) [Bacillus oleivorans]|uniref:Diacylglycerol kinase (ATP) n=1 Tax=Bacillus oleivorans TaxID=1448271 RepID=A0A285CTH4_9BACI|nr:YegS/Rv2252/BmrU family lipid kinase [Bacillus oleivorans]SNX70725.1 diacylglycerol kinase (ATP) [Bacillus oleivorans]